MIVNLLYIILAAFGLGLLIFIHELGHYWMARREGMTVEAFSIGFGKPIRTWVRDGVKWQICYLPFGGFVRIAGMEKKGALEPYEIPDGFFGKSPLSRIKVALAGPIVNIVFAFLIFCLLFAIGGRLKPFSEYTRLIGWVDNSSEIYAAGVRPGDEISQINGTPFHNIQDFVYAAVLEDTPPKISGYEIDYFKNAREPFQFQFSYPPEALIKNRLSTLLGSVQPASYLIYNQAVSLQLDSNSPMRNSGIENGDRILWADGKLMFSREELVETINQPKALLTIQRGDQFFLARTPRLKIFDLRLNNAQRSELEDWQHEAKIKGRITDLFYIPYNLTPSCEVESSVSYLNDQTIEQQPASVERSPLEVPLQPKDKIVAVDGIAVNSSYALLNLLQARHIQIIVKRDNPMNPVSWKKADEAYVQDIDWNALGKMIQSIGTSQLIKQSSNLVLLNPVMPLSLKQMTLPEEDRERLTKQASEQLKAIEAIKDPQMQAQAMQVFEMGQNQLKLGIVMMDRPVRYNPSPFVLFGNVFQETWKTIVALFSGTVSPKYMTGPVGIVHVMQRSWSSGFPEALFWMGMISLNLGVINLLPVPVLDGGHICFSLWEWITKKRIKAKTMERLIIPFIVLLVALFVYLTYNDLLRIFSGFFK